MARNKKYIVAVSSGSDSMALLDMCIKENMNIVVCHVNYRKRENSNLEMEYVKQYCDMHNIKSYILNKEYKVIGNFQSFARNYRYDFFKEISIKENCDAVLVAHQQDDILETYLMQKQKNIVVKTYGLAYESKYNNLKIIRPLLSYTKKELENYCINNGVKYFIDESNLKDDYTRNKIRHSIVENLTLEERNKILDEIKLKNIEKQNLETKVFKLISEKFEVDMYRKLTDEERYCFLRLFFNEFISNKNYSKAYFKEIDKYILSNKNFEIKFDDKQFVKNYTVCEIMGIKDKTYSFVIESNISFNTEYFKVRSSGKKIEGISVSDDEWPLIIRNYRDGDFIKLRFGTKKINRWFIDKKIPLSQRKLWPIVLNNKEEVIMVPGIGCDVKHYTIKPNIFVIK